jgi:hypothetical protein
MKEKHYQEKLSAFLNQELPKDERQAVAEHLLRCETCRAEHDQIKLAATLAAENLKRADAPENLWNEIEMALAGENKQKPVSSFPSFSFLTSHGFQAAAAAVLLVCFALLTAVYFGGFFRAESPEVVKIEPANQTLPIEAPQAQPTTREVLTNQQTINAPLPASANSSVQTSPPPSSANAKSQITPKENPSSPPNFSPESPTAAAPGWNVEALAGTLRAGNQIIAAKGKLTVGEILETDADSKARIEIADIGQSNWRRIRA